MERGSKLERIAQRKLWALRNLRLFLIWVSKLWLISLWFYSNVLQLFFVRFPGAILLFEKSTKRYFNCLIFFHLIRISVCVKQSLTNIQVMKFCCIQYALCIKIFFAIFLTMSFIDILFFFLISLRRRWNFLILWGFCLLKNNTFHKHSSRSKKQCNIP